MRNIYLSAMLTIALVGCATSSGEPIKMYPGEVLQHDHLVTLHPPSIGTAAMVLRIDGETPTSCWSNCMFFRPVQVLPGKHTFSSNNLNMPNGQENNSIIVKAPNNDRLHVLTPKIEKLSLFSRGYEFEFVETLEPGKHYQLKFATTTTANDWWVNMVTWWDEISAK